MQEFPQLHQAFDSDYEFTTFKNKVLNTATSVVKSLTRIMPMHMSAILGDLTDACIASSCHNNRVSVQILTLSLPILAAKTQNISELDSKLISSYNNLLNYQTSNQSKLKVSII